VAASAHVPLPEDRFRSLPDRSIGRHL